MPVPSSKHQRRRRSGFRRAVSAKTLNHATSDWIQSSSAQRQRQRSSFTDSQSPNLHSSALYHNTHHTPAMFIRRSAIAIARRGAIVRPVAARPFSSCITRCKALSLSLSHSHSVVSPAIPQPKADAGANADARRRKDSRWQSKVQAGLCHQNA